MRLRLPPSSRVERSFRLLDDAVVVEGTSSALPEAAGSRRGGSSEGVEVGGPGGVVGVEVVALVEGTVGAAFKLTFLLCQRPCIDLLRALGPWLTRREDCNRRRGYRPRKI
jgi:hypothetical protein